MRAGASTTSAGKVRAELTQFAAFVRAVDVSTYSDEAVSASLSEVRAVQRVVDGLVARLGQRANELAEHGRSAPAEEKMRGSGEASAQQAKREAARAEAATAMPGLGEALSDGELSGEHADVLARATAGLTQDQIDRLGVEQLVADAASVPVETFRRMVKRAVERVTEDHGRREAEAKRQRSEFRHWFDQSAGMGRFTGSLDPERYEAFIAAIEEHVNSLAAAAHDSADGPVTKNANLAAEAIVQLVCSSDRLDARRPSVTIVVDADTMTDGPHEHSVRETRGGHDLSPDTISRLCCDASLRKVMLDDRGVPLAVGRSRRTATDGQWAALNAIYRNCAWDGCTAPLSWCEAHHITEWRHGGKTDLDQLVPLCNRHHHAVHEGRWSIRLLNDRRLQIFRPDGRLQATTDPPSRVPVTATPIRC
jgi:hypothetical protein